MSQGEFPDSFEQAAEKEVEQPQVLVHIETSLELLRRFRQEVHAGRNHPVFHGQFANTGSRQDSNIAEIQAKQAKSLAERHFRSQNEPTQCE